MIIPGDDDFAQNQRRFHMAMFCTSLREALCIIGRTILSQIVSQRQQWLNDERSMDEAKKITTTKNTNQTQRKWSPRSAPKKKVSIEKCWKMLKSGDSVSVLFMSVTKPDPFSLLALYRPIETRVWNVFLFASCKHTHIAHTLHYTRRSSESAFSLFCHCDCPPHGRGQREIISYAQLLLLPQPNHFYAIFK